MASKAKKIKLKIDLHNWNTTDADEIIRRQIRAESEKFQIKNREPIQPYFGTYEVNSKNTKKYIVEIRSLEQRINSCNCPDYCNNGLGTCKHIEALLAGLRKRGAKKFKQAGDMGADRVEIFLDPIGEATVRVQWPKAVKSSVKKLIGPFFSSDGSLLGEPTAYFDKLNETILQNKKLSADIRVSQHIQHHIEYQKLKLHKQVARDTFVKDVTLGKQSFNFVKQPLFPYQQEGVLHLAFTERALLADEMGLGKTIQAIAACELLRRSRRIQRVLVVTTASLKSEWEEQIAKFTDLSSHIILGTRPHRLRQYQQNAFFYLMNYEQVVADHAEIQRLLAPDVIILDEAQRIKNWRTKTANAVKELKSRYAFVLTGTPIENRIDDIYSIVQFLDPRLFGALFRFNREFYDFDENGRPAGYKNLDVLYRRLHGIMLCRKKSDVEDELPQRLNKNYFVSMEDEQRARYEEYESYVARLIQKAKHHPLRPEEFERMQKWLSCMRMLCDTPYILDKNCRVSPKLDELSTILKELLEDPTAKIIVFSEWERMLYLVKDWLETQDWGFTWHTGSVPQKKRRENINQFKIDPNCRLFLSTDAGSVGLNLQAANVVINLDLPWNPAKLEQRIARAWRKQQKRPVHAINIICENSIEHRMLYLLEQKQLLAKSVLTGDGDLKTMKLPSGRAAFMERMEALMNTSLQLDQAEKMNSDTSTVEQQIGNVVLKKVGLDLDLLQHYSHPDQNKSILFAVCDTKPEILLDKLKPHLQQNNQAIEIVDRKTYETIQRLIDAGILSCNTPLSVLYDSKLPEAKKAMQKQQIEEAKKHFVAAQHKQKMAQLLFEGDFHEESIVPLCEAHALSLQAFACLVGENKHASNHDLEAAFVQTILIDKHGLPNHTASLFSSLIANPASHRNIKELHIQQTKVFAHVGRALAEMA